MDWQKLLIDEWEVALPHIEDDLRIGAFESMKFVFIGVYLVNLEKVTSIVYRASLGASSQLKGYVVSFDHPDNSITIYEGKPGFDELSEWVDGHESIIVP